MLVTVDAPTFVSDLYKETKALAWKIFDEVSEAGDPVTLEVGTDLLEAPEPAYYFIQSGKLQFVDLNDRVVRTYSERDFVGGGKTESRTGARIVCREAGEATMFPREFLLETLAKKPALLQEWVRLQELESRLMHVVGSLFLASHDAARHVRIASFEPGETIIEEGSDAEEVFLLVEGTAVVTTAGKKVGTVQAGEMFGEIAFLTKQPRAATVSAESTCLIEVADTTDIPRLVRARPAVFIEMAAGLARRVVSLNKELVESRDSNT